MAQRILLVLSFLLPAMLPAETHDATDSRPTATSSSQLKALVNALSSCGVTRPLTEEELRTLEPTPPSKPETPSPAPHVEFPGPHSNLDFKAASIFQKHGCTSCHGPGGAKLLHFDSRGIADTADLGRIFQVLGGKGILPQGTMASLIQQLHKSLSAAEKKTLRDWAKEHGRELLLGETPTTPASDIQIFDSLPDSLGPLRSAGIFKDDQLIAPAALADRIKKGETPVIWNIGDVLSIKGSTRIGPLVDSINVEGKTKVRADLSKIAALEKSGQISKTQEIILYCGCCPVEHCPNIAPTLKLLHDRGYTNLKVLNSDDILSDWRDKAYPEN